MRKPVVLLASLLLQMSLPLLLHAKPGGQPGPFEPIQSEDSRFLGKEGDRRLQPAAQPGGTYFGGTVWNPVKTRYEAIEGGVWTFDSGEGSHFKFTAAGVNPFKYGAQGEPNPLHAYMEGWVGVDNSYSELPYFRRVSDTDIACVIDGTYSMHAGVFQPEANSLCYATGAGYGNNWYICIVHSSNFIRNAAAPNVRLEYDFFNETEEGFDFTLVYCDTLGVGDGSADVWVNGHTGRELDHANVQLVPGETMRSDTGPFNVRFCVQSDGSYSDEDGENATDCGAFTIDNIVISEGAPIHVATFEAGNDGWVLGIPIPGLGGDWSNIVSQSDLPPILNPCSCDFQQDGPDSVLVFEDQTVGGHGLNQDNIAMSPWIDLLAAGVVGYPDKVLIFDGYFELPLLNYIFVQSAAQWYPQVCPVTNLIITTDIVPRWPAYYFGGVPSCRREATGNAMRLGFGQIPPEAQQVRVGLGVVSWVRFHPDATGVSNSTPWFDNVRFWVGGVPGQQSVSVSRYDSPQDSFPEDGTLRIGSTGRIDSPILDLDNKGLVNPPQFSSADDLLYAVGGESNAEVWVQFMVRAGPGCIQAVNNWIAAKPGIIFQETRNGEDWYAARMDSLELTGGRAVVGEWRTTFHEESPSFVAPDSRLDLDDIDPWGLQPRMANDIFPDHLFTPGTRLNLFFKSRESEPYLVEN